LIHCRVHLFFGTECTEGHYTGQIDPNRDLEIGFRLKAVPEFFQIYLGSTRSAGQEIEVICDY
jgi:hypothetical protein